MEGANVSTVTIEPSVRAGEEALASAAAVAIVLEPDSQLRRLLRRVLPSDGFRLVEVASAPEALRAAMQRRPDILLLDLDSPEGPGVELIQRLREWCQVPILVLAASGQEYTSLVALEAGADEYVSKPFSIEELLARVHLALRRGRREHQPGLDAEAHVQVGDLQIELASRRITMRGRAVHLTPLEFRLLIALGQHPGQVVSRRQLLLEVWGPMRIQQTHLLSVYMAQLRHKIEADPAHPQYLLTEQGIGYRLCGKPLTGEPGR
jgi:two-component system, OmpR family, KDP operon response regulator KdpE